MGSVGCVHRMYRKERHVDKNIRFVLNLPWISKDAVLPVDLWAFLCDSQDQIICKIQQRMHSPRKNM
jgi:hypothetical protein